MAVADNQDLKDLGIEPYDESVLADPNADRGDNHRVSEEDLDEEAENAAKLRAAVDEAKAKEKAENEKVAKGAGDKINDVIDKALTDQEKAEAEAKAAAEAAKEKKPEPGIPLSRHKQILDGERARRAEAEAKLEAAARQGTREQATAETAKDEAKIGELEVAYAKHLADGEFKEAGALMKEIRGLERGIGDRRVAEQVSAAREQAVETVRYDSLVSTIEAAYPQMDPDHESFDKETVADVLSLKNAFMAQGAPGSVALQKAVKYVLRPANAEQVAATTETPAKGTEADTEAARKAAAISKALDAAAKQPPNASKIGLDSDKAGGGALDAKAVMKMSQSDFAKLGDEELAKLRGDDL